MAAGGHVVSPIMSRPALAPRLCLVLVLLARAHFSSAAPPAPVVTWHSSPASPGSAVLLRSPSGSGFSNATKLELCSAASPTSCSPLPLNQPWDGGAFALLPAQLPTPPSVLHVVDTSSNAVVATLNDADLWWGLCHDKTSTGCHPGSSSVTVFGRSLAFTATGECVPFSRHSTASTATKLQLTPSSSSAGGAPVTLSATRASCYSASFALPCA